MSVSAFQSGDQIGHYRLIERIGRGGQGEVWRAKDGRFGRDVALKILPAKALADESARDRFRREALAVGKLNHPNIATAHDFDTKPVDYLVTEFVSGIGLDKRLSGGALPEATVISLARQLVAGLEAAHREGIIHRDLKPGNLRINQEGNLKILDFGLAEMFDPTKDVTSQETITLNMTLTGTVPYMAPEQFGGVADQRTDLWSVGAVLYEMATGRLPFQEKQIQELRHAIQRTEPPKPREVNPVISSGLEQVILRCLKKNPNQRYQTATELREDLERLEQGRKTRVGEQLQGRQFALLTAALVLAVSALAGYHYWPQIKQKLWPPTPPASAQFRLMAILPIESSNQNPADDALVRGMAETVTASLSRATQGQKLQLIPPSELISRGAKTSDAARREFGVERVLEVSVQRSGDKVRVTCSLIDPKTSHILNACSVTGENNDLFALQDNLVGEVIAMLPDDARSPQAEPKEVLAAAPAGYEFYLKGRGYLLDYQKPENIDAAIKEFEGALKVSPNYAPAYAGLGEAYWQGYKADRGKAWLEKASVSCQKSLAIDPNLAEGYVCFGNTYVDRGRYQDAVVQFQKALEKESDNVYALGGLGLAYEKLNDPGKAEETYQRAIAARPQYWAVYNWMGKFYAEHARYAEAAPMFEKVIQLTPDNQRGYYNLSGVLILEGRYDEAIKAANQSIKLRPTLSAYIDLGAAYFWQHDYTNAIAAFEKARELDDQDYQNWGNLADALYWSPSRRPEAMAAYKRAIALAQAQIGINPRDPTARAYVAEYSAMVSDNSTALEQIRQAMVFAPNDPDVMFRAALVFNRLEDQQETLKWLQKAVAANFSRTILRDTPDFEHLQSNAAFQTILAGH